MPAACPIPPCVICRDSSSVTQRSKKRASGGADSTHWKNAAAACLMVGIIGRRRLAAPLTVDRRSPLAGAPTASSLSDYVRSCQSLVSTTSATVALLARRQWHWWRKRMAATATAATGESIAFVSPAPASVAGSRGSVAPAPLDSADSVEATQLPGKLRYRLSALQLHV